MRKLLFFLFLALATGNATAQTKVQRGVARMITRSASDPIVPVQGVQVVVGNTANRASDKNGRFSMNIAVNKEQSYSLTDVRLPKGSKLILASPSRKKKLFLDNNELEVSLISQDEKNMVSRANYKTLLKKYNEQAERVRKLREQLEAQQAELDENSAAYRLVTAKRDSVQQLLNLYYDDKTYEQTLKDLEAIAEDLALTDYQSLDSIEARIYNLKMQGDWPTISSLLIRLMGGNASAWLHAKLDRRNQAAKDFAMGMEMIKEAIEAFKMQHLNDSVSYYYEILIKADSTNCDNLLKAGAFESIYRSRFDNATYYYQKALHYAYADSLQASCYSAFGDMFIIQENYSEAEKYYKKALDTLESINCLYSGLASIYNGLAITSYKKQYNYKQAEKYLFKALKIQEERTVCKDAIITYENIAEMYLSWAYYSRNKKKTNDYRHYVTLFKKYTDKAIGLMRERDEESSLDAATCYNNMGFFYMEEKPQQSLDLYFKALEIKHTLLDERNPIVAVQYLNIGTAYVKLNNDERAEEYWQKALDIYKALFGDLHVRTVDLYCGLGLMYASEGKYDQAQDYYNKSLKIYETLYGKDSNQVKAVNAFIECMNVEIKYKDVLNR